MAWELALVAGLTAFGLVRTLAKEVEILGEWVHIGEKTAVLTPGLSSEESDLVADVMSALGSSPMWVGTSEGATITAVNEADEELCRLLHRGAVARYCPISLPPCWNDGVLTTIKRRGGGIDCIMLVW